MKGPRYFKGDWRGWISIGVHDAQWEQIEFSAAVHGALDQLQAVNMSFDWTVAPRLLKGIKQRGFIVAEVFCKTCQQTVFWAVLPVTPRGHEQGSSAALGSLRVRRHRAGSRRLPRRPWRFVP